MRERFKIYDNGYKFDKNIFRIALIFLVLFFSVIVLINGVESRYYYSCVGSVPCDLSEIQYHWCKPLSKLDKIKMPQFESWLSESNLCNMGFAPAGFTFGKEKGLFQGFEVFFTFIIIILSFLINHLLHNKNFEFKGGLFE